MLETDDAPPAPRKGWGNLTALSVIKVEVAVPGACPMRRAPGVATGLWAKCGRLLPGVPEAAEGDERVAGA